MKKQAALWASSLADRMMQFVAFKRMQGYTYTYGQYALKRLDAFLTQQGCQAGVLLVKDLRRYAGALAGCAFSTRAGCLSAVRQFSLYLHALVPASEICPARLVPRHPRTIRFAPLSPDQIVRLMQAGLELPATPVRSALRPHCFAFLIGLLYSTGLRISEALALNLCDVDLPQSTLLVRRGKFCKERFVPLSPSTQAAVAAWLERRRPYASSAPDAPLLVVSRNKRLGRDQAEHTFRHLCEQCGLTGSPPPRLHDLRHNYASECLARWRAKGADIAALLPVLATAMGHVHFGTTQVYLHTDAGALQEAAAKFDAHAHRPVEVAQ